MSDVQLPEGWVWKRLEEVCLQVKKTGLKFQDSDGHIRYVDIDSINNREYRIEGPKSYFWKNAPSRAQQVLKSGDVVFSTVRTYLKNIALVPPELDGEIASTGFCVLRSSPSLVSSYLFYYVLTNQFLNPLSEIQRGTSYPAVRNSDVLSQTLPLPPLPVQHQIVARIEELFSELDAGVKELKTALARLKTYRQAVLHHYLNKPDWERVKLGEVIESMQYGTSDKAEYDETGVPVLRMGNIQDGSLDFGNLKYFSPDYPDLGKYFLEDGDVLFNRTNSAELVGKTAVYKSGHPQAIFASYLIRLKVKASKYLPEFLNYYINSSFGRGFIKSVVSQNVGQANVNGTKLKGLIIPLPDLDTQTQIVSEIEARLSEADAMETTIRQELARAENLRQSILKQAFSGKLVTGPVTPIPAEELAEVSEPVSSFYGSPSGDQLTLF